MSTGTTPSREWMNSCHMRIEYANTFKDVLLFHAVHQFLSPVLQFFYIVFAASMFSNELDHGVAAAGTVALLLYAILWLFQFMFNAVYHFSRHNRGILTRHVVEVRDEGLYEETAFGRALFFWPGVIKVVSRPGFTAIYVAAHQAHVIPSRFFASAAERANFVSLVRQHINGAASRV